MQIKWIESVLYRPDGTRDDSNPLYTFTYDPRTGVPGSSPSYPGEAYDDSERSYPPVEPYEDFNRYAGAKVSEGYKIWVFVSPNAVVNVQLGHCITRKYSCMWGLNLHDF